jgi:hypothetical protein
MYLRDGIFSIGAQGRATPTSLLGIGGQWETFQEAVLPVQK